VTAWEYGALVVSTLPGFQGGLQPPTAVVDATATGGVGGPGAGRRRADVDVDDYTGGFGIWSGTSFAAPLLAGRLAAALFDAGGSAGGVLRQTDGPQAVERTWSALTAVTGIAP
jgi:hypothetical protein